ncbi:HNH endonuclease signature motif containing protein [Actinomyces sp. ZJ308]|uniref:HNH endonuclease signature motif containing protein n=1 Tax=Actinomyces sp. ZJ308 TaxID=2708342 RepID=UPI002444A512|nr:HNH endonuclease signature motif containing protein [Actinomyces sp. ZJ308]
MVGYEERRFNTTCLLQARLGVSRTRAGQVVDHGTALMSPAFGPVEAMERCGVLDAAKAWLVTRRLEEVPALVALEVQEQVLPQAPRRSLSQLGCDIERALIRLDPEGHAERAQANLERRGVSHPRPAGEGICRVSMLLPAMDALLLDATLDAIAASARAAGEERTLAQLRADAMTTMTLQTLRTSQMAAYHQSTTAEPGSSGANRPEAPPAPENPTPDTMPGVIPSMMPGVMGDPDATAAPGTMADPGAAAAGAVAVDPGRLLPDGVPLEGLLSALSSLVGSTSPWWRPSPTGYLPLPDNIRINVNVTVPLTSLVPPGDPIGSGDPGSGGPGGGPTDALGLTDREPPTTSGRNLPTTSGRSLSVAGFVDRGSAAAPVKSVTAAPVQAAPDSGTAATTAEAAEVTEPTGPTEVTDPIESREAVEATELADVSESRETAEPVEVAEVSVGARGVAVPAATAWCLAAGGTWRRLVTDPASGVVIDVGRSRYRPPAGLADLVRARDRSCVYPTCQMPAQRCDIDHLTAWNQGGTTSLDNLVTLCQAHHRLKHTPGWALTRDEDTGVLSWHTPDKTVYQRHPNGTINRLPRRVGPRQHHIPGTQVPTSLSNQITIELIDRLNTALTNTRSIDNTNGLLRLTTRGPAPGETAGDYETTPYPHATHTLGLAPLIDTAPPF